RVTGRRGPARVEGRVVGAAADGVEAVVGVPVGHLVVPNLVPAAPVVPAEAGLRAWEAVGARHPGHRQRAGEGVVLPAHDPGPVAGQRSAGAAVGAGAQVDWAVLAVARAHQPGRLDPGLELLGGDREARALAHPADHDALPAVGIGAGAELGDGA